MVYFTWNQLKPVIFYSSSPTSMFTEKLHFCGIFWSNSSGSRSDDRFRNVRGNFCPNNGTKVSKNGKRFPCWVHSDMLYERILLTLMKAPLSRRFHYGLEITIHKHSCFRFRDSLNSFLWHFSSGFSLKWYLIIIYYTSLSKECWYP